MLVYNHNYENKYNLFSIGFDDQINDGLYNTIIDMRLNGGLGSVVIENKQISGELHADCITAVKHGNGRDWWVIGKLSSFPFVSFNRFFVGFIECFHQCSIFYIF